jgi:hypothetical protein
VYQRRGSERPQESAGVYSSTQERLAAVRNTAAANRRISQNTVIKVRQPNRIGSQSAQAVGDSSAPGDNAAQTIASPPPAVFVPAATRLPASPWAGSRLLLKTVPGAGRIRIEGTANRIHPVWWVQGTVIAGMLEVGPGFPTEPGQIVAPGQITAQATNVFIRVRSLKSIEADGKPYSGRMDEIMYGYLKEEQYPVIRYRLSGLALAEVPVSTGDPYSFDSAGELTIAGITRKVSFPVSILPLGGNKLKLSGSTVLKMSDYKVGPVEKNILGISLKTGDEVKLSFEWVVRP